MRFERLELAKVGVGLFDELLQLLQLALLFAGLLDKLFKLLKVALNGCGGVRKEVGGFVGRILREPPGQRFLWLGRGCGFLGVRSGVAGRLVILLRLRRLRILLRLGRLVILLRLG